LFWSAEASFRQVVASVNSLKGPWSRAGPARKGCFHSPQVTSTASEVPTNNYSELQGESTLKCVNRCVCGDEKEIDLTVARAWIEWKDI